MSKLKVAVLRGGPSSEYDVSLKSGGNVLKSLDTERYIPTDVFITKDGVWHIRGIPVEPRRVLASSDVLFNALHGEYGEDGVVQRLFESFGAKYTGSSTFPSALAMNKVLAKERVSGFDVLFPHQGVFDVLPDDARLFSFFRGFPQPSVVKPAGCGSSVGVVITNTYEELRDGVREAFKYSPKVIIEEYVKGREATCGVIESFRGKDVYALPPIEIIPPVGSSFFDYEAKYGGESKEICPSTFIDKVKAKLEDLACRIHKKLGLRHYSRSDFIVSPKGIYFLEVNTLPGLTSESLLPKSMEVVGCSFPEFVEHVIGLAQRP